MAKTKLRAREAGVLLSGKPGLHNGITDVKGVEVGYATLEIGTPSFPQEGDFARTGVTAILPRGKKASAVFCGRHDLNGNGELTGTHWMDDSGFLHGPIMITNTNSVGTVRDATSKWMIDNDFYYPMCLGGQPIPGVGIFYPTVGETWDGILNDISGFHVTKEHVLEALESAKTGPVAEGNVGGGTGMVCHEYKGGTGTSSRVLDEEQGGYTIGVLVQANHGTRKLFQISGVPVGSLVPGDDIFISAFAPPPGTGSIIAIVATDAPLLPHQLAKMCKRVSMGISALGGGYENGSGDIFLAFSTANDEAYTYGTSQVTLLSDDRMNPLYLATAQAVEEAILNALFAAETMEGKDKNTAYALPVEKVLELLKKNGKAE